MSKNTEHPVSHLLINSSVANTSLLYVSYSACSYVLSY